MSEELKKYKLVKINPDNYQFIQQLYKDCFDLKQTLAEIEEKYNTSEFNIRDIGLLAFDGNQPAAYYGIFPVVAEYNGQDFQIAQTGDVMTSPNYRKKGLFTFLAKKIHLLAKEYGIELIYGFPNKNSTPGFKRNLEWQFYGTLQNFNFKIDVFPFSELEIKSRLFKPFYSFLLKRKISKYQIPLSETEIPAFNKPTSYIKIKKDIHFFKYKSGRRRYLIKYKGFELFIKVNVNLQIGDVAFFDK
ncbi:MAG: GNAT family N-acetyltransferase, partial [Chitinophagales bacterium]